MNYFLVLLLVGIAGYAYYQHSQDEQQVTDLQQQLTQLQAKDKADSGKDDSAAAGTATTAAAAKTPAGTAPAGTGPAMTIAPAVRIIGPTDEHSSGIDAAAHAATAAAASDANNLGTITTLDGRTFENCKVLKVESDGVTFSHDDGITKVLFPFLPPAIQKQFDYDPHKAVAQTDAQMRYDQQQQTAAAAATNTASAPTSP